MIARDVFRALVKDQVTPAMRERGFRGGSSKYFLRDVSGHIGSVQLVGNPKRSGPEQFVYDVVIGVRSSYLQRSDEVRGKPPLARPLHWPDHDWIDLRDAPRLRVEDDPDAQARWIIATVDAWALPAFRRSFTDDGLRWASDLSPHRVGCGWPRILQDATLGRHAEVEAAIRDSTDGGRHPADHPVFDEARRLLAERPH